MLEHAYAPFVIFLIVTTVLTTISLMRDRRGRE